MITNEAYQDIQILQDTDFENIVSFDSTHDMTGKQYKAYISQDYVPTSFTGPSWNGSAWVSGSVTRIPLTVVVSGSSLTITLPAEATTFFADGWEGKWDLLEKDTDDVSYKRQLQGDVLISNSVGNVSDF